MDTKIKKIRAELNRVLQACATREEFYLACFGFQDKYGWSIWDMPTTKGGETFQSLADTHEDRVNRDDLVLTEGGQVKWRETVSRASAEHLPYLESQYINIPKMRTKENAQALLARTQTLGLEEFFNMPEKQTDAPNQKTKVTKEIFI